MLRDVKETDRGAGPVGTAVTPVSRPGFVRPRPRPLPSAAVPEAQTSTSRQRACRRRGSSALTASRMSTTWAACSPVTRCGRSSAIAAARSATPRPQAMPWYGCRTGGTGSYSPPVARPRRSLEVLEAAERERRRVAVELHEARCRARTPDVEAAGQPDDGATLQLDHRDDQVRAADPVWLAGRRHALGEELPAARSTRRRGPRKAVTMVSG